MTRKELIAEAKRELREKVLPANLNFLGMGCVHKSIEDLWKEDYSNNQDL